MTTDQELAYSDRSSGGMLNDELHRVHAVIGHVLVVRLQVQTRVAVSISGVAIASGPIDILNTLCIASARKETIVCARAVVDCCNPCDMRWVAHPYDCENCNSLIPRMHLARNVLVNSLLLLYVLASPVVAVKPDDVIPQTVSPMTCAP